MGKFEITEELLSELELLESVIKNNVAGMFGGNRKSKSFGSSPEFADYRDYADGDDVTKIDWNAYARFDKLYLKLYLDERQMHTRIYIDASRSMSYGDVGKDVQALRIAAALAYISVCEMDKVSVYAIKGGRLEPVISGMVGKEAYLSEIGKLSEIVFDGESLISDAIAPSNVGYGDGMSVIISDFLTDADYETAINTLADKKRDIFCIQVLSREELLPLSRGRVHFFDSEVQSKSYRKNIDRAVAKAYKEALVYATERINRAAQSRGGSYILASAEDTLGEVLFGKMANVGVLK